MTPTTTFVCSICEEPSVSICVYCTKDACSNHLCERCGRCSDCCECDIRLDEHQVDASAELTEREPVNPEPVEPEPLEPEPLEPQIVEADEEPVLATETREEQTPLSAEQWTEPDSIDVSEPEAADTPVPEVETGDDVPRE